MTVTFREWCGSQTFVVIDDNATFFMADKAMHVAAVLNWEHIRAEYDGRTVCRYTHGLTIGEWAQAVHELIYDTPQTFNHP